MGYYWMRFGTGARRILDFLVEDNSRWGEPEGYGLRRLPIVALHNMTFFLARESITSMCEDTARLPKRPIREEKLNWSYYDVAF